MEEQGTINYNQIRVTDLCTSSHTHLPTERLEVTCLNNSERARTQALHKRKANSKEEGAQVKRSTLQTPKEFLGVLNRMSYLYTSLFKSLKSHRKARRGNP